MLNFSLKFLNYYIYNIKIIDTYKIVKKKNLNNDKIKVILMKLI